jgi:hypothetical protein
LISGKAGETHSSDAGKTVSTVTGVYIYGTNIVTVRHNDLFLKIMQLIDLQ